MNHANEVEPASSFLGLPAELRSKVYSALLGGHVIHIGGTGHQPYTDEHLPAGRCCPCTATLSDEDCFENYTAQGRGLKGALPVDRFSRRHRDCHRYPVSRRLRLDILLVCKQIYQEAASLVFEENTFTLARSTSLPPFLNRLNSAQCKCIRKILVYSVESPATWIGPFNDLDLTTHLPGLSHLQVFIELKDPYERLPDETLQEIKKSQEDRRMSGLTIFKVPQLNQVDVMILARVDESLESAELDGSTLEDLVDWQTRLKQMLLSSSQHKGHALDGIVYAMIRSRTMQ